jgi:hypothetical protein
MNDLSNKYYLFLIIILLTDSGFVYPQVVTIPQNSIKDTTTIKKEITMKPMIKKIGDYYLTKELSTSTGIKEYSENEYQMAELVGMKRVLEDEKFFNGPQIRFANVNWTNSVIGTTKGKIYKIVLENYTPNKAIAKKYIKLAVDFINIQIGKYDEHPFLADKYIWDTSEGNIIVLGRKEAGIFYTGVFFTSNIIREQMLDIQ